MNQSESRLNMTPHNNRMAYVQSCYMSKGLTKHLQYFSPEVI